MLADGRSEQPTALQLLPRRPAVASAIRAMLSVLSTRNATSTWDEKERTGGLAALGKYMDCGDSVPLCGTLTLETGLGPGAYRHGNVSVHGLWPEVGEYGTSRCIQPTGSADDPTTAYSCYADDPNAIDFETHEWDKHGKCAGVRDVDDFFGQVCALAKSPLATMAPERAAGASLSDTADALTAAGFPVWDTDAENSQVLLSVCAGDDGKWMFAEQSQMPSLCKGKTPGPAPSPPSCVPGVHGPACDTDADCAGKPNCVRCAHSGFCTDEPPAAREAAAAAAA